MGKAKLGNAKGASEERPKAERYRPLVRNTGSDEQCLSRLGQARPGSVKHREAVRNDRRWSDTTHRRKLEQSLSQLGCARLSVAQWSTGRRRGKTEGRAILPTATKRGPERQIAAKLASA